MEKEERGKISEKIIEILGLKDYQGDKNMVLIRDENGKVLYGMSYEDEVIDLTQFIEDYCDSNKNLVERIRKEIERLEIHCKKEKHNPYGVCDCQIKIDELVAVLENIY
jgi:hypothetical protein